MHLTREMVILGHPAVSLRNYIRHIRHLNLFTRATAERCASELLQIAPAKARELLGHLIENAYVEPSKTPGYLQATQKAATFAVARVGRPIPRAAAAAHLDAFLARVHELNATETLTHTVSKVIVFGSYATTAPLVADVDLLVTIEPRHSDHAVQERLEQAARERSTRNLTTIFAQVYCGYSECLRFLKARDPRIHLQQSVSANHDASMLTGPHYVAFDTSAHSNLAPLPAHTHHARSATRA